MGEKSHVGLRIPTHQKERWERAQDASNQSTMSEWLKHIVESHLADSPQTGAQGTADAGAMGEVLDRLDTLADDVSDVQARIDDVQGQDSAPFDVDRVLIELLPEQPEGEAYGPDDEYVQVEEYAEWATTAEELANRIGGDRKRLAVRLTNLADDVSYVRSVHTDDETYYWVEADY